MIETSEAHGSFDMDAGIFTAKTTGRYLFQFSGVSSMDKSLDLYVNKTAVDKPNCSRGFYGTLIFAVIPLSSQDQVDIVNQNEHVFYETNGVFSAFLLSSKS